MWKICYWKMPAWWQLCLHKRILCSRSITLFFLFKKDLVKAGLDTEMYFKILGKLVQYVLIYYQLTMKCIRAFADSMQACIVLYIIYQSSPITNRSVIGMLSSIAWNPVGFFKEGTEEGSVPVAKSCDTFSSTGPSIFFHIFHQL